MNLLPSLVRKHLYPRGSVGGVQVVARLFILARPSRVKAHGWSSLPRNDGKAIDKRACNELSK